MCDRRDQRDRRDRRDRRGIFQYPSKRKTEPREREAVDVDKNTEGEQWSKETRARFKGARKIGASRDGHLFRIGRTNVRATADTKHNTGSRAEFNRSARKIDARPIRQDKTRRGDRVSAARPLRAQDHSASLVLKPRV